MSTTLVNVGDTLDARAFGANLHVDAVVPLPGGGYIMVVQEPAVGFSSWPFNNGPKNYLVTVDANGAPVGRPVKIGEINNNGSVVSDIEIKAAKALADGSLLVSITSDYGRTASLGTVSKTGEIKTFHSAPLLNEDGGTAYPSSDNVAFGKDNTIALARIASDTAGLYRTVDILSPKQKLVASIVVDRNVKTDENGSTEVTALADGRFLVTWVEEAAKTTVVKAQVVTKLGKLDGSTFVAARVNDLGTPGVTEIEYEVAALAGGGFAVTLESSESYYDQANPSASTAVRGNIEGKVWIRTESGVLKAGPSHITVATADAKEDGTFLKGLAGLSDGRYIEIIKEQFTTAAGGAESTLKGYVYDSAGDATGEVVDFLYNSSAAARFTAFDSITALADGRFVLTFRNSLAFQGPEQNKLQIYGLSSTGLVTVKGATAKDDILKGSTTQNRAESIGGLDGNDQVFGYGGNDRLFGNRGNDFLDGGKGSDRMEGGFGNDVYIVDHFGDIVVEARNAGIDTVRSSVSYGLTANVENLTLTGKAAIDGHGNALNNVLTGNEAANEFMGFGGEDVMQGGAGNDTYHVNSAGDRVIEKHGAGKDTILTTVSYSLKNDQSIEVLKSDYNQYDGAKTITLTGNDLANTIVGHSGANVLNGKGGADILTGGDDGAVDVFVFDTALGRGNVDRITDFQGGYFASDKIHLDDAIFKGLAKGGLSDSAFKNTTRGTVDRDDRILYNEDTGALSYDADGSGKIKAVQFAVIGEVGATTHPELMSYSFFVI
ncbi:calcium-binding protein [Methylorubrum sp. SB2]|uniref:calcium-binding protein n=1 Tax=Methylorubrum subtropicum TaxID=3138812 RepID=UPI00313D6945